jgi:hypothetical protein
VICMCSIIIELLDDDQSHPDGELVPYIYSDTRVGTPRKYSSGIRISGFPGKTVFHGAVIPTEKLFDNIIETIFRVLPAGYELRALVARVALITGALKGDYEKQEGTVNGFGEELFRQFRYSRITGDAINLKDPFTDMVVRVFP